MILSAKFLALAGFVASAPLALAQSPLWGQCGGQGWTGPTTCVAGSVCTFGNPYYSQCLPGNAPEPTTAPPTTTALPTTPTQGPIPSSTGSSPQPTGTTLAEMGKSIGWKYVGGATDPGDFNDSTFVNTYTREFNAVTPVNSMKWDATERSRNSFSFGTSDQLVAWAQQRNFIIRGHTCVWHSQLPGWVSNGGFNAATLTQIIQNHVTTLVQRYKGKLYAWDVVNEIFEENGTFRRSVFYNTLGESFVEIAFRAARAADPSTKLYINDYNTDSINSKSTAVLNIVKKLKSQGVPIDGIGVQAHLIVGQIPSTFQANLEAFASAGVEVAITELDIRTNTPASSSSLAQQQRDYQTVFAACKRVSACVGIQVWGLTDKYSWIPSVFPGEGAALPWDNNYNKKPAYDGIVAGLRS